MESTRCLIQVTTVSGGLSRRKALACLGGTAALLATARPARSRAQATPPPQGEEAVAPNHFALSGTETQLTYEPATAAGGPRVTYDGPYGRHTVVGDEMRVEESALGQLVTWYLGAFPDQGELWMTLLLPRFTPMSDADPPLPLRHPGDPEVGDQHDRGPPAQRGIGRVPSPATGRNRPVGLDLTLQKARRHVRSSAGRAGSVPEPSTASGIHRCTLSG